MILVRVIRRFPCARRLSTSTPYEASAARVAGSLIFSDRTFGVQGMPDRVVSSIAASSEDNPSHEALPPRALITSLTSGEGRTRNSGGSMVIPVLFVFESRP